MDDLIKVVTSLGFPAAIAILMWWNNRQIVTMLNSHYTTLMTLVENSWAQLESILKYLVEDKDDAKGN